MRVLVTGVNGFAGRHVVRALREKGHEPVGFGRGAEAWPGCPATLVGDLRDQVAVRRVIAEIRPEACIHLAAIASVPDAETDLSMLFDVNTAGTLRLLNAVRRDAPACRLLVVSTSQVYGTIDTGIVLDEDAPQRPVSAYAVSKAAADIATLGYAAHYGLFAMTARPANHTGPGQSESFVVASFARQLREARERDCILRVGNLDSVRAFLDVRDVAAAYVALLERGRPGEAYNIAPAERYRVGDVLARLARLAGRTPVLNVDPALYRPTDSAPALSTRRLAERTGWRLRYSLDETLRAIFEATE